MQNSKLPIASSIFMILLFASCKSQTNTNTNIATDITTPINLRINEILKAESDTQVGEYIVEAFEDSKGNIWFGTLQYGVARYTAKPLLKPGEKSLTYFTIEDDLPGNGIVSIIEDENGILWFGTQNGLSKYDGKTFTSFFNGSSLKRNLISNLLIDSKGRFWVGTWAGVSLFDGKEFSDFNLPTPDLEIPNYQETENWITEIIEDKQGNIWFSRSGYAVCKYDGTSFTIYTKEDGLPSNCVQSIFEDKDGNIWFTSRIAEKDNPDPNMRTGPGGLSKLDIANLNAGNKKIIQFLELEGLYNNDVYGIYTDKSDNIWIPASGVGIYKYDGSEFTLFNKTDKENQISNFVGVQSMLEDSNGNFWIGCSGGLFKYDGLNLINITQIGPWD